VVCIACGKRLDSSRRYFREITKRAYRICANCNRAQPHSIEFDPPRGANIDAAAIMYERFRSLFERVSLNILVWGPDPRTDDPVSRKRSALRDLLKDLGHKVYFSEELIFDKTYKVPANIQERVQVSEMDAVVCLVANFGALQEAQEFGRQAREFLLWLSDGARGRYTDSGLAQQLRFEGRTPVFFKEADLDSCVIATASSEWVEQRRMKLVAIEAEKGRLEEIAPRRGRPRR
jgi:hypothetical protein